MIIALLHVLLNISDQSSLIIIIITFTTLQDITTIATVKQLSHYWGFHLKILIALG